MKQTNEGAPNRRVLENIVADYVLNCSICSLPIVKIEKAKNGLIISSPLRRYGINVPNLNKILQDLKKGELEELDETLLKGFDGLDFYCRECDKMYCEDHYSLSPVWEGGFYDYTDGTCPEGHERIIDD